MKKYLLSLFAVVLAVGLSSFSPKSDLKWFRYDGDIHGDGETNSQNYSVVSAPGCSGSSSNVCEVHAQPKALILPEQPDFNTEIFSDRTKKP